jgi:hypothetical protein
LLNFSHGKFNRFYANCKFSLKKPWSWHLSIEQFGPGLGPIVAAAVGAVPTRCLVLPDFFETILADFDFFV